ncbi:PREDICTED: uncharacterized protein LOC104591860 [Nelumbo nucifera]|uniref:U5 small nuclear ribonucleoprotein TSSC4 n=2 Tax=Nelumbo nucifera TaxID=4432 RepID=A0A1U7Z7A8_NELNU|nr:PREDICTED: uncharacterized protein LOC104591860 [Nelumbo nucifera]XP_010249231.1 PREDICTED: uncharacterized protein LOC104591860 [Nelumbo nucifera]DAD30411.1 TPA_asm: hypothetical protein HUJ06_009262 [Nelumbo nucifera]
MEDSFRVRVDRAFGSLSSSPSSLASLWSLTDDEVERKEWNRERDGPDREDNPCSSSFNELFATNQRAFEKNTRNLSEEDLEDLDDDDGDGRRGGDEFDREEWEIRSSIGMDCTLDKEDEEDEYDKVAIGKENAGDRLYMRDVIDYGIDVDSSNVVPNSFEEFTRDPRANHLAAKIRLKEDQEAAASTESFLAAQAKPAEVDPQVKVSEDGGCLKSILKRKENQAESKSQKRVRFDPECKENDSEQELEEAVISTMVSHSMETGTVSEDKNDSFSSQEASGIPDYLRNPSKYTRYSFDSTSEVDEGSNRGAYMDFLDMVKKATTGEPQQEDTCHDLPKSVTFTPRKKTTNVAMVDNSTGIKQNQEDALKESMRKAVFPLGIAAGEAQEGDEACMMEEDDPETLAADKTTTFRKSGRQYRTKSRPDDSGS